MDESVFFEKAYRVMNKFSMKTKQPRTYGTEYMLYPSEVHMIEVIGSHEKLTATRIAEKLGITKGAVSQTSAKLLEKKLIQKSLSESGKNEILISLTQQGYTVYQNHRKLHADMLEKITRVLNQMPKESIRSMEKLIDVVEQSLDDL